MHNAENISSACARWPQRLACSVHRSSGRPESREYFEAPERKKSPYLNESQRELFRQAGPTLEGERKRSNFKMLTQQSSR
jgi:hypothetical protein